MIWFHSLSFSSIDFHFSLCPNQWMQNTSYKQRPYSSLHWWKQWDKFHYPTEKRKRGKTQWHNKRSRQSKYSIEHRRPQSHWPSLHFTSRSLHCMLEAAPFKLPDVKASAIWKLMWTPTNALLLFSSQRIIQLFLFLFLFYCGKSLLEDQHQVSFYQTILLTWSKLGRDVTSTIKFILIHFYRYECGWTSFGRCV